MSRASRCISCHDVIGVYEPMVVVDHAGVRRTSRAAEPGGQQAGEARYHGACYERSGGAFDAANGQRSSTHDAAA
jgi:hypothetical protein